MPTQHSRTPSSGGSKRSFSGSFRAEPSRGRGPVKKFTSERAAPSGDRKTFSKPAARSFAKPFSSSSSSTPRTFARPAASSSSPRPSYGGSTGARGGYASAYGRPSTGGSSFGGPRKSFGGGGGRSFGGGGRGGRRGGGNPERIDTSRFIRKAEKVEEKPYIAKHTFADFPFDKKLHASIEKKGFEHPMPIQDQAIIPALEGRDVLGLANTGTGKTAAFLLPLIQKVMLSKREQVLILAPTRELALQIEQELTDFVRPLGIFSVSCVGGMPITKQIRELKRGVHFVIGTPGRIRDLIDRKALVLTPFRSVVLDEADRMLDMGFRDDMEFVLNLMAKDRQTLFFSATLSPEIKKLTEKYLHNPVSISVVVRDTSKNVDQDVIRVTDRAKKIEQLHDVLIEEGSDKVLIFRETKRDVDELERDLRARGFKVGAIHGDKRNRERIRTLEAFKTNELSILIATDVAARGLDIPNVTHVINYDVPQTYDTYVHRIGRTGRANQKGKAITFIRG
jgi:ATP-dependent RNA helicase RhlE